MKLLDNWKGRLMGDRYELNEWIAEGGMSNVFKALDRQNNSWVAVKIATRNLAYDSGNDNLVTRLRREAEALRKLKHPRIVRLLDAGEDKECFFIVLEYLEGKTLQKCISDKDSVTNGFLASIIIQMLEGLEAMRKAELIHRDLKPANIMIVPDGVKIIDLGLVKFTCLSGRRKRRLTDPYGIVGTPKYLSPEQFKDRENVDARSDLYNCGVIMYELLTGASPYITPSDVGKTLDYWRHPLRPFPDNSKIPAEIQTIILKAMSIAPNLRYQTAEEMRLALLAVRPFSLRRFLSEFFWKVE